MANKKKSSKAKRAKGKTRARAASAIAPPSEVAKATIASEDALTVVDVSAVDDAPAPITATADAHPSSSDTTVPTLAEDTALSRDHTPPREDPEPPASPHTPQRDVAGPLDTPAAPSRSDKVESGGTPYKSTLDGRFEMADHTLDSVRGYVRQDLLEASPASVEDWVDLFLGVPPAVFRKLTDKIAEEKWFKDRVVQEHLRLFCYAKSETQRYEPTILLMRRIFHKARLAMSKSALGLPAGDVRKAFPIDDIHVMDTSIHPVATCSEQGSMGAKRKPDLLLVRERSTPIESDDPQVGWTEVLTWFELKFLNNLAGIYNDERAARGLRRVGKDAHATGNGARKKPAREPSTGKKRPRAQVGDGDDDTLATQGHPHPGDPQDRKVSADVAGGAAALQSGSYALEALGSTRGTRTSCFGAVMEDDKLHLWHYDACGIIHTANALSLVHDFEKVAAITIAIACCTPEHLGAFPTTVMKPLSPYPDAFPPTDLKDNSFSVTRVDGAGDLSVTLRSSLTTSYALTGRRSFIYVASISPGVGPTPSETSEVIVKFSYQAATRVPEQGIIQRARDAGVEHLPIVHAWNDLWKLPDSARVIAVRKKQRQTDAAQEAIDDELKAAKSKYGLPLYEDRIFRAIVYPQYQSIKKLFTEQFELIPIMVDQMIDCLHDLRYKANILHRDVSINNIMYEIRDGRIYFILIDFDMAVYLGDAVKGGSYRATSKNRTGTLPFMASELILDAAQAVRAASKGLKWIPIPHVLRHDFESLFHVSFWSATALKRPGDPDPITKGLAEDAKELEVGTLRALGEHKDSLCTKGLQRNSVILSEPVEKVLLDWFNRWSLFFNDVYGIRNKKLLSVGKGDADPEAPPTTPYDDETIDGLFTRDTLKAALLPLPKASVELAKNPRPLQPDASPNTVANVKTGPAKKQAKPKKGLKKSAQKAEPVAVPQPRVRSESSKQYCSKLRSSKQ